jgi:hypothetical protein
MNLAMNFIILEKGQNGDNGDNGDIFRLPKGSLTETKSSFMTYIAL